MAAEETLTFGATVEDAGGGMVSLMVDRDTATYPAIGAHVIVTTSVQMVTVEIPLDVAMRWAVQCNPASVLYPFVRAALGAQA